MLTVGTRLGPYEVTDSLGAGGMGEVYRARDTKLQRDVAIKVLPDLFARDLERLARFEREARMLAALNHPHIAQVYGVEGAALVMEFVDGEDLSQRIARAGAIPVEDALPIAIQIAEALEAAHEQGIIHRDLKPANIKVRPDGTVKVLDFGLAKALSPPDLKGGPAAGLENSPTITSPFQMSQLGVILGTAAYMAPEQAKGKPVDKRADIWAFGCVLFEMLTGTRPFGGEDVTDTLAAIVRADPDWSALPPDTQPVIRKLLRRCLEKDRGERLPDIGAARLDLKDARSAGVVEGALVKPLPARRTILPWIIAAVATLAALAVAARTLLTPAAPAAPVYKTVVMPPSPLSGAPALRLAISHDGRRLAFAAPDAAGNTVLWVRPLDSTVAQPLVGTSNASSPFWSPDSRSIGFIADGKLRRVDASGGPVMVLCDAPLNPPGAWSRDDVILFTGATGTLSRVSASGGTPVVVTELTRETGERVHITPFFLPDGQHFLYTAGAGGGVQHTGGIFIGSLGTKKATRLLDESSNAQFANGHLLFLRDTTLMAQRFDPDRLQLSGEPIPVATDVQINPATGTGAFSVSQSGVLVFQSGPSAGTQVTWRDRSGKVLGTVGSQTTNRDVQLSLDDQWASLTLQAEHAQVPDVWLFDLARGLPKRFTFGGTGGSAAVWSPDGRRLAYASRRGQGLDLVQRDATGSGGEEILLDDDSVKYPLQITRDGRWLLYWVPTGAVTGRLWLLPLWGDRTPRAFAQSPVEQVPAEVSPDVRWLAYVSDETGRREVFVTSFPDGVGKWQVSTNGGDTPRWRANGKELFFIAGDRMMAADVVTDGRQFDAGAVRPLFEVRVPTAALGTRSTYAVSADGQRFLVNMSDTQAALTPLTLVVNWTQALKK